MIAVTLSRYLCFDVLIDSRIVSFYEANFKLESEIVEDSLLLLIVYFRSWFLDNFGLGLLHFNVLEVTVPDCDVFEEVLNDEGYRVLEPMTFIELAYYEQSETDVGPDLNNRTGQLHSIVYKKYYILS